MAYRVQVCLGGESVGARVAAIWSWIDHQKIDPPVFRYRMTDDEIVLQLDFTRPNDAEAFREHFGCAILGLKRMID